MDIFEIFGYLGSASACLMMLPQLFLTIKKRSFDDLSIKMISINLLTQCFFFPYSTHFKLYPLIIVNTTLATCDIVILTCYCYHKISKKDEMTNDLLENMVQDTPDGWREYKPPS
jgi:uncharacterized protein with PQ loop repeat